MGERLCEAVRLYRNEEAIGLILNGANVNHQSECLGVTPMHLAIGVKNIPMMEYLVYTHKVDYRIEDVYSRTPAIMAEMSFQDDKSGIVNFLKELEAVQRFRYGTGPLPPDGDDTFKPGPQL